jgi:serine/threonine protein kinase
VYKATLALPSKVKVVAVKVFSEFDYEEFTRERRIHSTLQHPNVLPLLGYCRKDNEGLLLLPLKKGGDLR